MVGRLAVEVQRIEAEPRDGESRLVGPAVWPGLLQPSPCDANLLTSEMKQLGVYIHIPFCVSKCAYCDFVSYPIAGQDVEAYLDAVLSELVVRGSRLRQPGWQVSSIYVGGGTPTSVPRATLCAFLSKVLEGLETCSEPEVTLEANPGTIDVQYASELISSGVNRISLGIQSFCDRTLSVLGRIHTASQAAAAFEAVRAAGAKNVNIDLIYGTPGETPRQLEDSLLAALALVPEHISVYGLSIESGTKLFEACQAGRIRRVEPDAQRRMYEAVRETLAQAGYRQYEISNWSRPGFECRHNLNYWRRGEYLGLGCWASSFLDGRRTTNLADPKAYIEAIRSTGTAVERSETLSRHQRIEEAVMLGLRLREGLSVEELRREEGFDILGQRKDEIERLLSEGLIEIEDDRLRLTDNGLPVADEIVLWLI